MPHPPSRIKKIETHILLFFLLGPRYDDSTVPLCDLPVRFSFRVGLHVGICINPLSYLIMRRLHLQDLILQS
jgi:hypothetical protein